MRVTRPDWDLYFLRIAQAVAARADCSRRQVGAVIADTEHRIASSGYNGSYPGGPSCLAGQCPRARSNVDPGSSYDTGPGACHSVHAEANALLFAERSRLQDGTLYVTCAPCDGCMKLIRNTTLWKVVWPNGVSYLR